MQQVCSIHFIDGCPTKLNPGPQLHMGYGYHKEVRVKKKYVCHTILNFGKSTYRCLQFIGFTFKH